MTKAEKQARAARARAMLEGADEIESSPARVEPSAARDRKTPRPAGPARDHPRDASQPAGPQRQRADLAPFHGDALSDALKPRRWEGPPKRGDLTFWRGQRVWIARSHPFDVSRFVLVCDKRIKPDDAYTPLNGLLGAEKYDDDRHLFHVHVDELDVAPPVRSLSHLPTVASAARAERAKVGIRDVGDDVAVLLRNCGTLADTYSVASEYLGVPVAELTGRYSHLNPGQQRMNLGNRMRAKWRKGQ